ncbi:hypothetical protein ACFXG4_49890 [Nocardia sp. NPDC059246]|uniref:hypothetical protein n=1 Tax=unclassified Nocardia TaxID=2637762 RepID=UPI0036C67609
MIATQLNAVVGQWLTPVVIFAVAFLVMLIIVFSAERTNPPRPRPEPSPNTGGDVPFEQVRALETE